MTSPLTSLAKRLPRCTAIIGGGGKTTLMLTLAAEKAAQGGAVLMTTTTHLAWPPPSRYPICSAQDLSQLATLAAPGQIILCGDPCGNGRMTGVDADAPLAALPFDWILVEADGSNRLPLKYHREQEPCLPTGAELVIQVAGLSALGQPIHAAVHRWQLAELDGSALVTPQLIAALLLRGRQRYSAPSLALLNQADTPQLQAAGAEISRLLAQEDYESILCSLRKEHAPCWY